MQQLAVQPAVCWAPLEATDSHKSHIHVSHACGAAAQLGTLVRRVSALHTCVPMMLHSAEALPQSGSLACVCGCFAGFACRDEVFDSCTGPHSQRMLLYAMP